MYSYIDYSKSCICCKCNVFILLDGYVICSNCGLVLQSFTYESDFVPAGYFRRSNRKRKKESKQRKKEKFKKYYLQKYKKVNKSQ